MKKFEYLIDKVFLIVSFNKKIPGTRLIENTFENFKYNAKPIIIFEMIYKLLSSFLLIPILLYILNDYPGKFGFWNITNTDLLALALTPSGLITFSLLIFLSFIAIFIEMGILTYLANKSHYRMKATLLEGVINCIKIIPKTFSFHLIFLVFLAGIIGPLTGIGLYNSIIKDLTIPSFITLALLQSFWGKLLFYGLFFILIILLLRWIMSIPAVVIENVKLKEAFKNSIKIYKDSKYKIAYYLIAWGAINFLGRALLLIVFLLLASLILFILGPTTVISKLFAILFLIVFIIGYTLISIITLPLFISFLVELYYKYRYYSPVERPFTYSLPSKLKRIYHFIKTYHKRLTLGLVSLFSLFIIFMSGSIIVQDAIHPVNITAHRGSSLRYPENSLTAISQSIQEGAQYVEIDVMASKDNRVVLFHDSNLKRIDGTTRKIKDMTLEEIETVDNGSYKSPEFAGEKIPTLEEVFELTKGKIKLNIELKPSHPHDPLPKLVAQLIKDHHMENHVVVTSLDYQALEAFQWEGVAVKTGYILSFGIGDFTTFGFDFISIEYQLLSPTLVHAMHAIGREVHVWTLNKSSEIEYATRLHVDNIITDNVPLANAFIEKASKEDKNNLTWLLETVFDIIDYVVI